MDTDIVKLASSFMTEIKFWTNPETGTHYLFGNHAGRKFTISHNTRAIASIAFVISCEASVLHADNEKARVLRRIERLQSCTEQNCIV